jgi:hypothetical protein
MWQIGNVNCIILPVLFLDKLETDAGQAGSPIGRGLVGCCPRAWTV